MKKQEDSKERFKNRVEKPFDSTKSNRKRNVSKNEMKNFKDGMVQISRKEFDKLENFNDGIIYYIEDTNQVVTNGRIVGTLSNDGRSMQIWKNSGEYKRKKDETVEKFVKGLIRLCQDMVR